MDIKGLQYFIIAAERLNFTTAAKECYITQTAMSLHIGKMEDELGFKLFIRDKRVVELTEAGKDFLKQARHMVHSYEVAIRHSASIAGGIVGILNVMVPSVIEAFAFMDIFWEYRAKYPEVEFNIIVEPPSKLISGLKTGRCDISLGSPEEMLLDPDLNVFRLREDPIVIACSKLHPFAKLGKVTAEMLSSESAIICEAKGLPITHRALRNSYIQAGFEPKSFIDVGNLSEMMLMIELNRGVGFLPDYFGDRIDPRSAGIAFLKCEYKGKTPTMTTALCYMKDNSNPVLPNFLDMFLPPKNR